MSGRPAQPRATPRNPLRLPRIVGVALLSALLLYLFFGTKPWSPDLDFSRDIREPERTHAWVLAGMWWGAAVNAVLLSLALGLSFPFQRLEKSSVVTPAPGNGKPGGSAWTDLSQRQRRLLVAALAAILALSAWLNFAELSQSLWGDEAATARRYVVGNMRREDDGSFRLITPRWQKTLWNFDTGPNNHILFSVLSRLSHSLAPPPEDPEDLYFSEAWMRLPSYLVSLGAVGAVFWLAILLGAPRAAPVAALLVALHPTFIEWGVSARGYPLLMMLSAVAVGTLTMAVRQKAWRWWLLYAAAQWLLFMAHLGSLFILLPLNLAALVMVWTSRPVEAGRNPLLIPAAWRLLFANLMAAMLVIQCFAPCVRPLQIWLDTPRLDGDVSMPWIHDWLSTTLTGMPWKSWELPNPKALSFEVFTAEHPWVGWLAAIAIGLGFIAGCLWLAKKPQSRWLALPLLLPVPLMVAKAWAGGQLLYSWYTVGYLPLLLLVAGIGLVEGARRIISIWLPSGRANAGAQVAALTAITLFAVVSHQQRQLYRHYPSEASREALVATRSVINPFAPNIDEVLTVGFVHPSVLYDPAMIRVYDDDAFIAALRRADASGLELSVNAANIQLGAPEFPRTLKMLYDAEVFEPPTELHGQLIAPNSRYVFRYRPGGVKRFLRAD